MSNNNDIWTIESLEEGLGLEEANRPTEDIVTPPETDQQAIERLAQLPELEYENVRKSEAKKLGFRADMLDKFVRDKRPNEEKEIGGRKVVYDDCERFEGIVVGHEALNEALEHITRHMHISQHDAVISVLWAAHTHIYTGFNHTPRLIITAPEPECGKTVLLFHMIGNLSNKVLATDNLTPAVYFRLAEQHAPTFLIDEGDVFLNQDSHLIAGFNNGFEPHGGVFRCVGDDHEVRKFPTFAPLALAGIKLETKLPAATRSRAFIIHLERVRDEIAESDSWDRDIHEGGLICTRGKIAKWIHDNKFNLGTLKPELPKGLKNRSKDKWSPLFSIAEIAGGDWPTKVLNAYTHTALVNEPTNSEQFLIDVKSIIPASGHIHTQTLIDKLCEMDDSRYLEYNFKAYEAEKKKIQPAQISKILKGYRLRPKDIKISGTTRKGYDGEQLRAVLERYITNTPSIPPQLPATPLPVNEYGACSDIASATLKNKVAPGNELQANKYGAGSGVAPKNPAEPEAWEAEL